jgi:hypothetical protein
LKLKLNSWRRMEGDLANFANLANLGNARLSDFPLCR